MTEGAAVYPPSQMHGQPRARKLLLSVLAACVLFGSWQFLLALLEQSNHCYLTPPGHFDQEVISVERTPFSVRCVLDPNNGEPRYSIHLPWQSVRGV